MKIRFKKIDEIIFKAENKRYKEVGTFVHECTLKITSGGIFYSPSTAVMKRNSNSTNFKVVAVNVINTSMYNDRCCIATNFCSDDCNIACHVKLVICNEIKTPYVSKEMFLIAGTNTTNHKSGMIYQTCNNLVMLHVYCFKRKAYFRTVADGINNIISCIVYVY